MAKKKPIKNIFDSASIEAADAHPDLTESTQREQDEAGPRQDEKITSGSGEEVRGEEPRLSEQVTDEVTDSASVDMENEDASAEANPQPEAAEATGEDQEAPADVNPDDLLGDVRRSLMEEAEVEQNKQESKWWRRIGKRGKPAKPTEPEETVEIDLPSVASSADLLGDQEQKQEPEEQPDEIDDLIEMLIAEQEETTVQPATPEAEAEPAPEPEPPVDIEKLKEQAFRARTPADEPENDVRSVALEGGEEVFVEVQSQVANPVEERLSAFENALKPYRWYINIALAIFGLVVAALASLLIFNVYQRSRPQPVRQPSNLPYPTAVSLPGGWSFQLGRGALLDGKWQPNGPEWLEGTEVCRWVGLPWSRQLEAVIRTLNPKDPIELTMSNNDTLTYKVYSVRQLSPAEMQKLDSNSPCLLIILTQSDSEDRWVLTALP